MDVDMRSSHLFKISRETVVPSEGRATWINTWGKVPAWFEVSASAELADWEGSNGVDISSSGEVKRAFSSHHMYPHALSEIEKAIAKRLTDDPTVITDFDATEILRSLKAARAEKETAEAASEAAYKASLKLAAERIHALSVDDVLNADGTRREDIADDDVRAATVWAIHQTGTVSTALANECTDWIDNVRAESKRRVAAAEQARVDAVRSWVAAHSDGLPNRIVRAASEGIDVRPALRKVALQAIDSGLKSFSVVTTYGCKEDQRVPTDDAYAVLDAITALLPSLHDATLGLAAITIEGLRRVDVCSKRGTFAWRSAVRMSIAMPLLGDNAARSILTEPLNWPPEAEDEDE